MIPNITLILIFLMSACLIVPLFLRLGMSPILGYLMAGILIGPHCLNLTQENEMLSHAAELGVIFLLFVIGLELKPSRLWAMRRAIFGTGQLQVVITVASLVGIGYFISSDYRVLIVAAMGFSLSSTAIGAQMLSAKGLLNTHSGRLGLAILLFQDLVVILMMAILPMLGKGDTDVNPLTLLETLRAIAVILLLIFGGRYLTRPILHYIAKAQIRELSVAVALLLVLSSAILMQSVGLSAALGAFLSGVLLADSEYRHAIQSDIKPFEGLLMGLFFIVVGTHVRLDIFITDPIFIIMLVLLLIFIKLLIIFALGLWQSLSKLQALQIGLLLAQGGEFGFVLFTQATNDTVISSQAKDILVLIVTLSMVMTPVLWMLQEYIVLKFAKHFTKSSIQDLGDLKAIANVDDMHSSVMIAGFGRFGQTTARLLAANKIDITVLDSDPEVLNRLQRAGIQGFFGDASRIEVLEAAGLEKAKVLIIVKRTSELVTRLVKQVKYKYPHIKIVVRAKNPQHAFELEDAGADHIERETYAPSVAVAVETLKLLGTDPYFAYKAGQKFTHHDKQTLAVLKEISAHDSATFISESQRAQKELEKALAKDKEWVQKQTIEEW